MRRLIRSRYEAAILALLALWTLVPLAVFALRPLFSGGVFTGVTGIDPYDQFQYLAWIRDTGLHGLSASLFGMTGGGHVFLQPMYLISGALWRIGTGLQTAYLIWVPISVLVLWVGYSAFARRHGETNGQRAVILVIGLFFATPLAWLTLPNTHWVAELQLAITEATPALRTWFAPHEVIALGLAPLILLGAERILDADPPARPGSRIVIQTATGAAITSWLHSWTGACVLLVIAGAALTRRPRRQDAVILVPLIAGGLPLVYLFLLTKLDAAWKVAERMNDRPDLVVFSPQMAVLGPLVLAAAIGVWRRRPAGVGERMVLLWPVAAIVVYLLDPAFPPHALEGIALPLSVLAVRGWPRGRAAIALGLTAVAVFTVPGLANYARSLRDVERANRTLFYLPPRQNAALRFLAHAPEPGAVLAPMPLSLQVPAFSDREVWVGHQVWTPDPTRLAQVAAFYAGTMSPPAAQRFVRATGARWVLADCDAAAGTIARLAPMILAVHRFGCFVALHVA